MRRYTNKIKGKSPVMHIEVNIERNYMTGRWIGDR